MTATQRITEVRNAAAVRAEERLATITVAGIRSPILDTGPGAADEAVVFVHGNPGSSRDWEDMVGRVAPFARAIAFDMPGFGRADKPENFDYTVEGYARYLGAALDALRIKHAHLVLHDFGGPWGLAWAAMHPQAFASVTLIDIGILPGYSWHYLAKIWRMPLVGEIFNATTTRFGFHSLLKHGNPRGLPKVFVDRMYDDYDRGTKKAVLKLYRATSDFDSFAELVKATLKPLNRPALVVWGKHDPYLPVAFAQRQRDVFPDAQIEILEGSGHWPFVDDPEQVAALVVPFLKQVVSKQGSGRKFRPPRQPALVRNDCRLFRERFVLREYLVAPEHKKWLTMTSSSLAAVSPAVPRRSCLRGAD
ncbi:MAG: alpha/beta fold hydrolase [Burkholderiales bacterium]